MEEQKNDETSKPASTQVTAGRLKILERIHQSMSNGIRSGKAEIPRKWLKQKGFTIEATGACFNSGQMHHRKPQEFIDELKSVGFLKESSAATNTGKPAHTAFGHYAVMFPLKDENNQVVNFYAVRLEKDVTHHMNEEGIYPSYPPAHTKKLFIVNNVLGAATILSAQILDNKEAVMALHDGRLLPQHEQAIKSLPELEEVIWIEEGIRTNLK